MYHHHAYSELEINLNAIKDNFLWLKGLTKPQTKIMSVVKANAYGHGSSEVASCLENFTDYFAVAQSREAINLRRNGIATDILVFGAVLPDNPNVYKKDNLIATVSSPEHFALLEAGTRYHIKFDTGMNRLGLRSEGLQQVLKLINEFKSLKLEGVFTHFSTADHENPEYFEFQLNRFRPVAEYFRDKCLVHASNSAAMICRPEAEFDMVRPGIALYGIEPCSKARGNLKSAMKWISRIVAVRKVPEGEGVSYGATWKVPADGYLAVIPVGYADGIPRVLSGKTMVNIHGKDYPQVGVITMDNMMIWLGNDHYEAGEEVIILDDGKQSAGVWSELMGTIPYEIFCNAAKRALRSYSEPNQ